MTWKALVNGALVRTTGLELRRARPRPSRRAAPRARLVRRPTFVLSTVRSGSTLLRVLLDSHSQLHAPPEIHLRDIAAEARTQYAERSLRALGLDPEELRFLLWDRLLQRELARSGKAQIVSKAPSHVHIADDIARCWPDARFVYLLRHPGAIAASRQAVRPQDGEGENVRMVLDYADALERARRAHEGLTVRYEELTADPGAVTRRLCAFLGVEWEPAMLDYGSFRHGRYRPGLGDWKEKIRSGAVQPAAPPPALEDVPAALHPLCAAWGYAEAPRAALPRT